MAHTESHYTQGMEIMQGARNFHVVWRKYSFLQAELLMSPFIYLSQKLVPELADCDAMFHLWSHGVSNGSLRLFLINYH